MKPFFLLSSLIALTTVLAPMQVEAQQSADKRLTKRHRASKGKIVRKNKGIKRPNLPEVNSAASADSSPAAHPAKYNAFLAELNNKAKANDIDICEALAIMLSATGDEFCQAQWMEQAAKDGNAIGMHYLGMTRAAQNAAPELRYVRGTEREALLKAQQDGAKEAAEWLRKAAELKYAPAMLDYSLFLRMGIGVRQDDKAANRMMIEAAKSGNFDTRFSWLLQNRRLTSWADKDRPEVAGEIRRGNHQVIYYLSQFAPDSKTQIEWLQKAATQKNGAAMYALSSVTSRQDPPQSLKQLKAAVSLHDPSAMYVYGSFLVAEPGEYHKSTGLEQNVPLGVNMLQLSCMLGNSQSRRTLARAYYRGELGMPRDHSKTYAHLKWLNSAQKDHIALAAQGFMLLTGDGVKQDIETGKRYITLAANDGYSYALAMMAYAHYKGIGTPRDVQKAIDVLQEAAATGFPHAYLYIAFLTAKGLHGEPADAHGAERYVNIAGLNLGNQAKEIFNELMKEEDWGLPPFPLENQ
ncbi:MAG: hypothetical protein Q4F40_03230 [Akkermansia sp.]|nr:hypothetical protein [Akkermansia sp.]